MQKAFETSPEAFIDLQPLKPTKNPDFATPKNPACIMSPLSPIAQTVNLIQHSFTCACLLPRMHYCGGMLSNTTSRVFFHYVYVLESLKDGNRYIGYTDNLTFPRI